MKTLHRPQPCEVRLEKDADGLPRVSEVRFRGLTWRTAEVLEVWTYWGEWWLDPQLEAESRSYFVLGTRRGELSVFQRSGPREAERGWFVEGWHD